MDVSNVAGALVVAVEPDSRQASKVGAVVRDMVRAELIIGDSARVVLAALRERAPDLVLASPLLPPGDEALIADRLRQLGASARHVQALAIPLLASPDPAWGKSGLLSLRRKPSHTRSARCAPEAFAEQVRGYLAQASVDRERHAALDGFAAHHQ